MANIITPANSLAQGTILGPDGAPQNVPTRVLTQEEARILRLYKKFLESHGLREALYCNACWDGGWHDGCEAHVTSQQILIRCRCRLRFHQGGTY